VKLYTAWHITHCFSGLSRAAFIVQIPD
jgi:hypothetical protein